MLNLLNEFQYIGVYKTVYMQDYDKIIHVIMLRIVFEFYIIFLRTSMPVTFCIFILIDNSIITIPLSK